MPGMGQEAKGNRMKKNVISSCITATYIIWRRLVCTKINGSRPRVCVWELLCLRCDVGFEHRRADG